MDDILKRMLAVEQDADRIIKEAKAEAEKIMADGLQSANELSASAQKELAAQVEALVGKKVQEALDNKKVQLEAADCEMAARLKDFRDGIQKHEKAAVEALLFPVI